MRDFWHCTLIICQGAEKRNELSDLVELDHAIQFKLHTSKCLRPIGLVLKRIITASSSSLAQLCEMIYFPVIIAIAWIGRCCSVAHHRSFSRSQSKKHCHNIFINENYVTWIHIEWRWIWDREACLILIAHNEWITCVSSPFACTESDIEQSDTPNRLMWPTSRWFIDKWTMHWIWHLMEKVNCRSKGEQKQKNFDLS